MSKDDIFSEVPELNYCESAPEIKSEEFFKVLESRRSVRVYKDEPIPEEVVRKCLDAALLAPNSSNLQPWEFYWVRSQEKKAKLAEYCLGQPAATTAAELIVCVGRTKNWKSISEQMLKQLGQNKEMEPPKSVLHYYKKIVPLAYDQGPCGIKGLIKRVAVFVMGLSKVTPREPVNMAQMKTWSAKSCALACENLMLSFRALGYDTCPMEGLDSKRVSKLLNLAPDAFVVMAISAGKRADNGVYGPQIRMPKEQFLFEV